MSRGRRRDRLIGRRRLVALSYAASLSCLAGMVDVVGFLQAGDFVSFMSGNTTRLAAAVGEERWATVWHLALLVLVFVLGNAAGVVFAHATGRRHALLIGLVALILFLAALWPSGGSGSGPLVLMAMAMGIVNVAVERVDGRPIGVTYVTGALSRFGRGLGYRLVGQGDPKAFIDVVPWAGMLVGGIAGAVLSAQAGAAALLVAALFAALLAAASPLIPAKWRGTYFAAPAVPRASAKPD